MVQPAAASQRPLPFRHPAESKRDMIFVLRHQVKVKAPRHRQKVTLNQQENGQTEGPGRVSGGAPGGCLHRIRNTNKINYLALVLWYFVRLCS